MHRHYSKVEDSVLEHLGLSRRDKMVARNVISRNYDAYFNLKRAKGGQGRTRLISAPVIELSRIQKIILDELQVIVKRGGDSGPLIHPTAHAYRKFRSHASAAGQHLGMRWGIKVDLKQFYDHITEQHVFQAFQRAGLGEKAYFYTKLCTRVPQNWPDGLPKKYSRFQRAITSKLLEVDYSGPSIWLARLAKFGILPKRLRNQESATIQSGKHLYRMLPPKRVQRIFPLLPDGRVNIPNLGGLDSELQFDSVFKAFKLTKRSTTPTLKLHRAIKWTRQYWRRVFLESYSNPLYFSISNGDKRQSEYSVRPEQYRMRAKIGHLPQGSPASGIISNMVMVQFDQVLFDFCKANKLRYTRYSDDIVISSLENNFSRDRALKIISFVQKLSEFNGFTLNKDKTRILTPGSRKYVLGVLVDGSSLRLGKHEKNNIERSLYQISKFGDYWFDRDPTFHILNQSHSKPGKRPGTYKYPKTPSDPMSSLLGWLSYCKMVDPVFLRKIHEDLLKKRWIFANPLHFQIILKQTSKLLGDKTNEISQWIDVGESKPAGPHWNPPLTCPENDSA